MSSSELQAALLALDEITAQRDEARWLVCEMQSEREQGTPEGWAEEFGWEYLVQKKSRQQ
jgi:hypothetical protein